MVLLVCRYNWIKYSQYFFDFNIFFSLITSTPVLSAVTLVNSVLWQVSMVKRLYPTVETSFLCQDSQKQNNAHISGFPVYPVKVSAVTVWCRLLICCLLLRAVSGKFWRQTDHVTVIVIELFKTVAMWVVVCWLHDQICVIIPSMSTTTRWYQGRIIYSHRPIVFS